MKVQVLTLFPRLFDNFLQESIVGIAREKGALEVQLTDWRDYTTDRHRTGRLRTSCRRCQTR